MTPHFLPKNFVINNNTKTCIVICGPTAVGKTSYAIKLAKYFNTQIISADSRQCYKELNIGVAKPTEDELKSTTHYFINSHSIYDNVNAGIFEKYALAHIQNIFTNNPIAIVVGGTGLYINALCNGIDEVPNVDILLKEKIILQYNENGLEWLQKEVKEIDPLYFLNGEINNPQRLMRALTVKLSCGKSITSFQTQQNKKRDFSIIKVGLSLPRDYLYNHINCRVENMFKQGLVNEVEQLQHVQHLNALQTVGYTELFAYFKGTTILSLAKEQIKINTRHYAKRQLTWFKKDTKINWVDVDTK